VHAPCILSHRRNALYLTRVAFVRAAVGITVYYFDIFRDIGANIGRGIGRGSEDDANLDRDGLIPGGRERSRIFWIPKRCRSKGNDTSCERFTEATTEHTATAAHRGTGDIFQRRVPCIPRCIPLPRRGKQRRASSILPGIAICVPTNATPLGECTAG